MNSNIKGEKLIFGKLVSLFLFLLMVFHLFITLLYNFRNTQQVRGADQFAKSYIEPLFTQNFKIFAPNVPVSRYELFVQYRNWDNSMSNWENKGELLLRQHQQNRFSAKGYEYLMYLNAIQDLLAAKEEVTYYLKKDKVLKHDEALYLSDYYNHSISFQRALHYLRVNYLNEFREKNYPKEMQCAIRITAIPKPSAELQSNRGIYKYYFFPRIAFNK